ncbi:hypothetical protein DBR11_12840 [Pedobacter sp. HMWF019]|nr:hypothetical protein DBR11_12840 [Pedobacter sp. HMWF019]
MNRFTKLLTPLCFAAVLASCSKSTDAPIVQVPVSDGNTMTLQGLIGSEDGGSAGNSVFVDFSADKQTSAARASWDLGFYSGADFRVIINHSIGATAIALDKSDLNQVTIADTIALVSSGKLALGQGDGAFTAIDPVQGSFAAYLSGTVIKAISATDADNKVYIVNRGKSGTTENRGWEKIRVIRSGNGYTLQYAKINETSFKSLTVVKDGTFNFKYVSFIKGLVDVEPAKDSWDIEWGLSTYKASATIPYTFSDFVLINFAAGVQASQQVFSGTEANTTVTYANFKESDLSKVIFSGDRDVIAGNWRITSGTPVGVKADRFYVVKDPVGNVYKLKFVSFHPNDSGVRGKPVIEYKLVKKA